MELISQNKCFSGYSKVLKHTSKVNHCDMTFSVFLPEGSDNFPALIWLSGLTCTHENFTVKSGVQKLASKYGVIVIAPDTSPRGDHVPDESDSWDFGKGAGFYLNATQEPWKKNYQMYDYIIKELLPLSTKEFPIDKNKIAISGHSMGGHGALVLGLRNPSLFKSISAFAPICNPTKVPWGLKAFSRYLGSDETTWSSYDACELLKEGTNLKLFVDQGSIDQFLEEQLKTDSLIKVCNESGVNLEFRMQDGYDHSYYFISTFLEDHFKFHFS